MKRRLFELDLIKGKIYHYREHGLQPIMFTGMRDDTTIFFLSVDFDGFQFRTEENGYIELARNDDDDLWFYYYDENKFKFGK